MLRSSNLLAFATRMWTSVHYGIELALSVAGTNAALHRSGCCRFQGERTGFTLVEILVVVAVIGLLSAQIFPAVQQTLESSRRTTCGNHLRQIGLGLYSYHDSYNRIPPGARVSSPPAFVTICGGREGYMALDVISEGSCAQGISWDKLHGAHLAACRTGESLQSLELHYERERQSACGRDQPVATVRCRTHEPGKVVYVLEWKFEAVCKAIVEEALFAKGGSNQCRDATNFRK
jgi:prepilin-type N-terminal cleavage/methylation domain-containing protein